MADLKAIFRAFLADREALVRSGDDFDGAVLVTAAELDALEAALPGTYVPATIAHLAVDDGTTDNLAYLQGLIDAVGAAGGGVVQLPPTSGRYGWAGQLDLDDPNVWVDCRNAPIRQLTDGHTMFSVSAADCAILYPDALGADGAPDVTGMTDSWQGTSIATRWTVVNAYASSHRLYIPWIRGSGFSSVVRLSKWDKATDLEATYNVEDVTIGTVLCSNVEFGFLAGHTDRLSLGNVRGSYGEVIGSGRPMHLLYLAPGDANSREVSIGNAVAVGGAGGQAFQLKGIAGGHVGRLEARACPGVLNVMDCTDLDVESVLSTGDTCTGVASLTIDETASTDGVRLGRVKIRMASDGASVMIIAGSGVHIDDLDVEPNHTTSGAGTVHDVQIRGEGNSIDSVRVNNVGAANSWRAVGVFSGSGHRVGVRELLNVAIGVDTRATNAVVDYDSDRITLHPTDGLRKMTTTGLTADGAVFRSPQNSHLHHPRIVVAHDFSLDKGAARTILSTITGHLFGALAGTWRSDGVRGYESTGAATTGIVVDSGIADALVEVGVLWQSSEGVIFRAIDNNNYLSIRFGAAALDIVKRDGGGAMVVLATVARTPTAGRRYHLGARFFGAAIEAIIDGQVVATHTLSGADQTKYGAATAHGLRSSGSAAARFDNFAVHSLT